VTQPLQKSDFDRFRLTVPQQWELAKKVQLSVIGSGQRAFHQAIDEPCARIISTAIIITLEDKPLRAIKSRLVKLVVRCFQKVFKVRDEWKVEWREFQTVRATIRNKHELKWRLMWGMYKLSEEDDRKVWQEM